ISQEQSNNYLKSIAIDSLLESDSSDDDDDNINNRDNLSLKDSSIDIVENHSNKEQQDTTQASMWIGTQNGG
ncbi:unnamed protein product, partial [Rotaria magnacalcarata]